MNLSETEIVVKKPDELSWYETSRLCKLSLTPETIAKDLRELKYLNWDCEKEGLIFICKKGRTILGWGLLDKQSRKQKLFRYQVNVSQKHRRMGIGTQLFIRMNEYLRSIKYNKKVYVYRHDDYSDIFFTKMEKRGYKTKEKFDY